MKSFLKIVTAAALLLFPLAASSANAGQIQTKLEVSAIAKKRVTPYNKYLSAKEAHHALSSDPSIVLIDVRDPIEINFIGHSSGMDANVPLRTVSNQFKQKKGSYGWKDNKNFVVEVDMMMKRLGHTKEDTVFVSCRSGVRSAVAARLLYQAGYKNVWNLVEGFEGSKDKKTGIRSKNGWRNAGLPWSYKIPATAAWQPLNK
ncbi:MAG: rhodanese-like domain-containing protein [Rhizobiaceae bacterium]